MSWEGFKECIYIPQGIMGLFPAGNTSAQDQNANRTSLDIIKVTRNNWNIRLLTIDSFATGY